SRRCDRSEDGTSRSARHSSTLAGVLLILRPTERESRGESNHYNSAPRPMNKLRQRVRYLRTEDGVRLAWAEIGAGPVLVKASNWLSHLEYELESPVWGHWFRFFGDHFRFVRWDDRGCGMTDREVDELSFERWVGDLEAVVAASGVEEPVTLLGISSGAAICVAYAARHPERVSKMVLYGGYVRGWARRKNPK